MKKLLSTRFIILSLSFFFYALGNNLFDLMPLHLETIALGKNQIGIIMSFSGLGGFAVLPLLLLIIDRVRLKKLLTFAIVLLVISQSAYLSGVAPYPFYAAPLFIRGALLSLFMISYTTLISHIIPENKRTMGLAVFGIMGQLPFPLSIGVGEMLYHRFGLRLIVFIAFSCFLISVLILRFFKEETPIKYHQEKSTLGTMLQIFKTGSIYPFLYSFFVLAYAFGTFQVFLPGFLFARGISRISLFWIVFPITIIVFRLLFSGKLDKFSRIRLIIPPLILLPVGFFVLLSISSYYQLIFPAVIYGIAHGILFPVLNASVIDHAPDGFRGRVMVISQLMISLGLFISAQTGGLIADKWTIDTVFKFTALFSCSAILLFMIRRVYFFRNHE